MLRQTRFLAVPNPGWRLYPAAVCLQAVLEAQGVSYPVYYLENVSGHPYGWFYLNERIDGSGQAVCMTPGTELTNSIKQALAVLGYDQIHVSTDDWNEALARVRAEIDAGHPVIFGPIAYRALRYQVTAWRSPREASH